MALGESLYDFSVYLGFNISEGSDQLVSSPSMIEALCRTVQPKFMRTTRQNSTRSRCSSPPKLPALVKLQQVGTDVSACAVEKVQSLNDQHIRKHTTEQTSTTTGIGGGVTIIKPRMFGLPGHTGMALDKDTMQEDVDSLLGDSRSQRSVQISQLCLSQSKLSSYKPQNSPHIRPILGSREFLQVATLKYVSDVPVAALALNKVSRDHNSAVKVKGILKQSHRRKYSKGLDQSIQSDVMSEIFGDIKRPIRKKVVFNESVQVLRYLADTE